MKAKKKRRRRAPEHGRRKISWLKAAAVVASILAAASAAAIIGARDSRKAESVSEATQASIATATATAIPEKRPDRTAELYAKLDRIIAAVRKAAKGDSYAERITEKFVSHAVPFYPVPDPQGTRLIGVRPRAMIEFDDALKTVFISRSEAYLVPKQIESPFFYDSSMKAIVCVEFGALHDDILGTSFLHEIVHWDGFMTGREKPTKDSADEQSVRGELFAHDVEWRAFDRLTHGDFSRRIAEVLGSDELSKRPDGKHLRQPTKAGHDLLDAMWTSPPLSEEEKNCRYSAFFVPFFLAQVRNEAERVAIYRSIRKQFSQQDFRNGY
jgi:hypothetical protein